MSRMMLATEGERAEERNRAETNRETRQHQCAKP